MESLSDEKNVLFVPPFGAFRRQDPGKDADAEPPARLDPEATVRSGDPIALKISMDALYFFDPSTERSIPGAQPAVAAPAVSADGKAGR